MVDDGTQRTADPAAAASPPSSPSTPSDPAAEAARAAQVAAFTETVERHHDDLARVAFVVSGDVELAAEAAQSSWTEAWKGFPTFQGSDRLRAWLMGIAAKEAKWLSEAGSRARAEATRGDAGIVPATAAASSAAYRSEELDLANIFAALDGHDRQIVALRYVAGLGSDDIGRELGMPANAAQARIARVLKVLLDGVRNLQVAGDSVEDYERALGGRIRAFASRAVVPLDADVIVAAAMAQAASEVSAADRLGEQLEGLLERLREVPPVWLAAAGGAAVLLVAFLFLFRGGGGGVAAPTAIPTDATRACEPGELQLKVAAWEPTGGDRVATVEMRNVGGVACFVDSLPEPWLVEAPQMPLLIGNDLPGGQVRIGPNDVMRSSVRVRNYCGPDPRAPVTIAFRRGTTVLVAEALTTTDLSGVPQCGGYAQSPNDVSMTPWSY